MSVTNDRRRERSAHRADRRPASSRSGKGGEVRPARLAKTASSPTQRAEKTRRARGDWLPGAPCTVRKLKAMASPGCMSQPADVERRRAAPRCRASPRNRRWRRAACRRSASGRKPLPQVCEPLMHSMTTSRGTGSSGIQKLTLWRPSTTVIGLVLVPGRDRAAARLLHEHMVMEEAGGARAHQAGGDLRGGRLVDEGLELGDTLPVAQVLEEGRRAVGRANRALQRAGVGHQGRDPRLQWFDPLRKDAP